MTRRYRLNDNNSREYHLSFDAEKSHSAILTPTANDFSTPNAKLADHAGCLDLLEQIKSKIEARKQILQEVADDLERNNSTIRNSGRAVPPESAEFAARRLKAEAMLDVAEEEQIKVQAKIIIFDEQQKKTENVILPRGPIGSGVIAPTDDCPSGRLVKIDFQNVGIDADGFPIIDEPRSPYNKMRTCDYVEKIVKPYRKACGQARAEQAEELRKLVPAGAECPRNLKLSAPRQVPWPEWPTDVAKPGASK